MTICSGWLGPTVGVLDGVGIGALVAVAVGGPGVAVPGVVVVEGAAVGVGSGDPEVATGVWVVGEGEGVAVEDAVVVVEGKEVVVPGSLVGTLVISVVTVELGAVGPAVLDWAGDDDGVGAGVVV